MRTFSSMTLISFIALSPMSLAAPQLQISKTSEGGFSVQYCDTDLRAGGFVAFQIENGILEKEKIDSSNCATKTYRKVHWQKIRSSRFTERISQTGIQPVF